MKHRDSCEWLYAFDDHYSAPCFCEAETKLLAKPKPKPYLQTHPGPYNPVTATWLCCNKTDIDIHGEKLRCTAQNVDLPTCD